MKHNNFIENKKRSGFRFVKFEFNYLSMLLFFGLILISFVGIQSFQNHRGELLQKELHVAQSLMPVQSSDLKSVEWSTILKKYTSNLPSFLRVREISIQSQNGDKMTLALLGAHVWDATRARENLKALKICSQVNLGKIQRMEDQIHFELECLLS